MRPSPAVTLPCPPPPEGAVFPPVAVVVPEVTVPLVGDAVVLPFTVPAVFPMSRPPPSPVVPTPELVPVPPVIVVLPGSPPVEGAVEIPDVTVPAVVTGGTTGGSPGGVSILGGLGTWI